MQKDISHERISLEMGYFATLAAKTDRPGCLRKRKSAEVKSGRNALKPVLSGFWREPAHRHVSQCAVEAFWIAASSDAAGTYSGNTVIFLGVAPFTGMTMIGVVSENGK